MHLCKFANARKAYFHGEFARYRIRNMHGYDNIKSIDIVPRTYVQLTGTEFGSK